MSCVAFPWFSDTSGFRFFNYLNLPSEALWVHQLLCRLVLHPDSVSELQN